MPIDFSRVKEINIPEGEVTKITDSADNVLWKLEEHFVGWHTVWEGNKKIGYGGDTGSEILFSTKPYSDTLKIRVSFNKPYAKPGDNSDDYSVLFTPPNKQSPVTYESFKSNITTLVDATITNHSKNNSYYNAALKYDKTNGKIYGSTIFDQEEYAKAYIVITKIEIYN